MTKAIDDFSWDVGDKLDRACRTLTRNSQPVWLILRDAWIEFSRIAREDIAEDSGELGRSDVKGVMDALKLPEDISRKAKKGLQLDQCAPARLEGCAGRRRSLL